MGAADFTAIPENALRPAAGALASIAAEEVVVVGGFTVEPDPYCPDTDRVPSGLFTTVNGALRNALAAILGAVVVGRGAIGFADSRTDHIGVPSPPRACVFIGTPAVLNAAPLIMPVEPVVAGAVAAGVSPRSLAAKALFRSNWLTLGLEIDGVRIFDGFGSE